MKEAVVTVPYDKEKLRTIQLYLAKKNLVLEDEVGKMLDALYTKQVPAEVRDYLCMASGEEPEPVIKQTRRKRTPNPVEEVADHE